MSISVRDLSFRYRGQEVYALRGISLELPRGSSLLLTGPSGCGKSTLLRAIVGLIPKYYPGDMSGQVLVDGAPVQGMGREEVARTFGFVFQNPDSQILSYRVRRDIGLTLENLGADPEEIRERVSEVAKELGIEGLLDMPVHELSDGQRQLVAIAGALAARPKVLMLDEPTSLLDPRSAGLVLSAVKRASERQGATLIVVEHRLDLLIGEVDYLGYMEGGRLLAFGRVREAVRDVPRDVLPHAVKVGLELFSGPAPLTVEELIEMVRGHDRA